MGKRKRPIKWVMVFRYEKNRLVVKYEPLSFKEIENYIRNGWEVVSE